MRGTGCGGVTLREASGQSARTTAIKARTETAVLRHAELQAGSVDDASHVTGCLILKQQRVAG